MSRRKLAVLPDEPGLEDEAQEMTDAAALAALGEYPMPEVPELAPHRKAGTEPILLDPDYEPMVRDEVTRAWYFPSERADYEARGEATGETANLARLVQRLATLDRSEAKPMILGCLAYCEHTIVYGPGGVGKGVYACDLCVRAVREGLRVLIVDYESHPTEWARRIFDLGGLEALEGVYYVNPTADWSRGRLDLDAGLLADIAELVGADIVVIDSISAACGGDPLDAGIPWRYQQGIIRIGRTALSLAHVTKAHEMAYPFGSVHWANAARLTWSLEDVPGVGIKMRCRKANAYRKPADSLVSVTWHEDRLREVAYRDFTVSTADRIADLLADGEGRTLAAIRRDLTDDDGTPLARTTVLSALKRDIGPLGRFTVTGSGSEAVYALRGSD